MSKKTGKPVKTNFFVPKILTVFNEWLWIVLLITRLFSTLSTQIAAHIKGEKVDYLKISEFTQKALTWAEYHPKQKKVCMKKVDFGQIFLFWRVKKIFSTKKNFFCDFWYQERMKNLIRIGAPKKILKSDIPKLHLGEAHTVTAKLLKARRTFLREISRIFHCDKNRCREKQHFLKFRSMQNTC